jgi:hypothetical protein
MSDTLLPHEVFEPAGRAYRPRAPGWGRVLVRVCVIRLVYGNREHSELGTWLADSVLDVARTRPGWAVEYPPLDVCPRDAARCAGVRLAQELGCGLLLSVDADTIPPAGFLVTAGDFLLAQPEPSVLVAPNLGGLGEVNVFRWQEGGWCDGTVEFTLQEAREAQGFGRIAWGGTGCYACHTAVFDRVAPPYFAFDYQDAAHTERRFNEDTYGLLRLARAGVPIFAAWDHWAMHFKEVGVHPGYLVPQLVGRPGGRG